LAKHLLESTCPGNRVCTTNGPLPSTCLKKKTLFRSSPPLSGGAVAPGVGAIAFHRSQRIQKNVSLTFWDGAIHRLVQRRTLAKKFGLAANRNQENFNRDGQDFSRTTGITTPRGRRRVAAHGQGNYFETLIRLNRVVVH